MDFASQSSDESDKPHPIEGSFSMSKKCESVGNNIDSLAKEVQEGVSTSELKPIKEKKKSKRSKKKQLVQEEEREKGRVSMKVYVSYMRAAYKGLLIPLIILAQSLFQLLQIASNWWMAWANPQTSGDSPKTSNLVLILVYMALAFGSSWFIFVRAVLVATFGLAAAQKLFLQMLTTVFRAPMSFFDSTPSGRILNRVSCYFSSFFVPWYNCNTESYKFSIFYRFQLIKVLLILTFPSDLVALLRQLSSFLA